MDVLVVKWVYGKRGVFLNTLNQLKGRIERLTNRYTLVLSLLLFLFFLLFILPNESARTLFYTEGVGSPDTKGVLMPEELFTIARQYGEVGRLDYVRSRFGFDLIWPLVYLFFFLVWMNAATSKKYRVLNTLPVFAFLFDLLENSFVSIVMIQYPHEPTVVAILALTSSLLKWLTILGCVIVLLIGATSRLKNRFHKPLKMV